MTTEAGFQTRFKTVKAVEGWRNAIQAKQCSTWPSYVWWVKVFYELSVELASQVSHSVLCLSALDMFHPERKFKKKAWNCHNQGQEWRDDEHHGCWMLSGSVAKGWTLSSSIYCPILNPITAEPTAVDFNLSGNIFSLIQRFMEKNDL